MVSHDLNLKSQNLPQPLSWQRYLAIMILLLLQLERQHLFLNFSRWPGYRNSSPNNSYRETSSGSRRSSRSGYSHAYCWRASGGYTILLCVCEEQQVHGIIQKEPTYNEWHARMNKPIAALPAATHLMAEIQSNKNYLLMCIIWLRLRMILFATFC